MGIYNKQQDEPMALLQQSMRIMDGAWYLLWLPQHVSNTLRILASPYAAMHNVAYPVTLASSPKWLSLIH